MELLGFWRCQIVVIFQNLSLGWFTGIATAGYVKIRKNGPGEIVDLAIKHDDFPVSYLSLPEGIYIYI